MPEIKPIPKLASVVAKAIYSETRNWHFAYLQHKLLKALLYILSSFCATFKEKAPIFPRKVNPLFFADDPFTFLEFRDLNVDDPCKNLKR